MQSDFFNCINKPQLGWYTTWMRVEFELDSLSITESFFRMNFSSHSR